MNSRSRGWLSVLLWVIPLWLPLLGGCALFQVGGGAGARPGTVAYVLGQHSQVHAGNYERVWSATLAALNQMNIRVIKTEKDALGGTITARRADDTPITIKVDPNSTDTATVKIRVGMFGDRAHSEAIQAWIVSNLRTGK